MNLRYGLNVTDKDYQKARLKYMRDNGLCCCCKQKAVDGRSYCQTHIDKRRAYAEKWHKHQIESGKCRQCHTYQCVENRNYCEKCIDKSRQKVLQSKLEIMEAYGGRCVCCGESTLAFLTIDHKNNDGKHDRELHGSGATFYKWLKDHNYPKDGYQILCFNCNYGRRIMPDFICPHQCPHQIKETKS